MKKIPKIILSRLIGMMIFLLCVVILNKVDLNVTTYQIVVAFLNDNLAILIALGIFFMLGELFMEIIFPFSLAAPWLNAVGALMLVRFVFNVFLLIDVLINAHIFGRLSPLRYLVYVIVFIAVIVGGHIAVFHKLGKKKKKKKEEPKKPKEKCDKEWEKIGEEFKQAFGDLFRKIGDSIDK